MPLYTHIITYVSLSLYLSVSLDISISICTSLSLLHSTSKLTHPRPSENSIPATGVIQIALLQSDNASGTLGPNLQWWFKIPKKMRYLRTQWSTHWPEMDWIKTYWLVVEPPTPLKNMTSSGGMIWMMTFPTEWKVIIHSCSKPPTRWKGCNVSYHPKLPFLAQQFMDVRVRNVRLRAFQSEWRWAPATATAPLHYRPWANTSASHGLGPEANGKSTVNQSPIWQYVKTLYPWWTSK